MKKQKIKVGNIIKFGEYDWRVLDVQDGRALLITQNIIEKRAHHSVWTDITWADCDLRKYLNGQFLNSSSFSSKDREKIVPVLNKNLDNQWFGTDGGLDTTDNIFLLSIKETVRYFGNSGQLKNKNPNSEDWIDDQYNAARIAKTNKSSGSWWWLRSPGYYGVRAAYVSGGGGLGVGGGGVHIADGGVRPALWIKL